MSDRPAFSERLAALATLAAGLEPTAPLTLPAGWLCELLEAARASLASHDLTVEAAAQLLKRKPSTVRGWCAAGDLPGAYRRGRAWYIPRAALERPRAPEPVRSTPEPVRSTPEPVRSTPGLGDWRQVRPTAP